MCDFVIDINDVYKFKAWACGMSSMQFEKLCITLPCISFLDTLHIYICLLPSPEHAEGLVVMMLILNVSKQWSSEFILNNEPIGSLPKHRQELVLSLIMFLYALVFCYDYLKENLAYKSWHWFTFTQLFKLFVYH